MNALIPILITVGLALRAACCADSDLQKLGEPFLPKDISIKWEAQDRIPSTCTVYKVVSSPFSSNLVSTLMEISGFNEQDRATPLGGGVFKDRDVRYYRSSDQKKYLGFVPSQGWVLYKNSHAKSLPPEPIVQVPTLEEALIKSKDVFRKMGIDLSDLATNPASGELRYAHSAVEQSRGGLSNKQVVARFLFFPRQVDGVSFLGLGSAGGVWIGFGNHNEICELEMVWRSLTPQREVKTVDAPILTRWIRAGRVVIQSGGNQDLLQNLRITRSEVHYLESPGNVRQSSVKPFIVLEATADTGQTNIPVRLFAPVLEN